MMNTKNAGYMHGIHLSWLSVNFIFVILVSLLKLLRSKQDILDLLALTYINYPRVNYKNHSIIGT